MNNYASIFSNCSPILFGNKAVTDADATVKEAFFDSRLNEELVKEAVKKAKVVKSIKFLSVIGEQDDAYAKYLRPEIVITRKDGTEVYLAVIPEVIDNKLTVEIIATDNKLYNLLVKAKKDTLDKYLEYVEFAERLERNDIDTDKDSRLFASFITEIYANDRYNAISTANESRAVYEFIVQVIDKLDFSIPNTHYCQFISYNDIPIRPSCNSLMVQTNIVADEYCY
jgi:hypothetical protein